MLSKSRKRTFAAVTLLFPVLFFFLLEAFLRLLSYGPNLDLFTTETIGNKVYHVMNPDVKARYFHRVEFSPNTSIDYFQVPKSPGTYRIFCLGGSTTVGFPYGYIGSFSTFMEDRLQAVFQDRKIEVINLGLTATNSFTVLDMAQEIVDYEPDLIVVYDGHNEFYGALGVASHESFGGGRAFTQLYLKLIHFRTFLLLRDLFYSMSPLFSKPHEESPSGTMMERLAKGKNIPYGSDSYHTALVTFRSNLSDLKTLCISRNIPLMVASQVSNERGIKPFVSGTLPSLTPSERLESNNRLNDGISFWMEGNIDSSARRFTSALNIDSTHAEACYLAARALDSLGMKRQAKRLYRLARDYDELRFRTSTDFNNEIAALETDSLIFFIDVEGIFSGVSPDSVVGNELILEHLHPNLDGYFLIAKALVGRMRAEGLASTENDWATRDTLPDEWYWNRRSITPLDELAASQRIQALVSQWPFDGFSGMGNTRPVDSGMFRIANELVRGKTTWEGAHVAAAQLYEARNELPLAEREYLAIIRQIPQNVSAYLILSQLYLRKGKNEAARDLLLASVDVEPNIFAFKALGAIYVDAGRPESAISFLRQAFALSGTNVERSENGYLLALAYDRAGKSSEAISQLQLVLNINPAFTPARELLSHLTRRK